MLLVSGCEQFVLPYTVLLGDFSCLRGGAAIHGADGCAGPVAGTHVQNSVAQKCCVLASVLHPFLVLQPIFNSQWAKTRTPSTRTWLFQGLVQLEADLIKVLQWMGGRLEYRLCLQLVSALRIVGMEPLYH